MTEYWYDIDQFAWNQENKSFYSEADYLFNYESYITFPNQGRQFFIKNQKTNNFRRFRLKHESNEEWTFESEDNIRCIVKKPTIWIRIVDK